MAGYPVVGVSASCTHDPQGVDIYDEEGNLTHYDLGDTVPLSKLISRRYSWLVNRGYLSEDFSETFDDTLISGDLRINGNLGINTAPSSPFHLVSGANLLRFANGGSSVTPQLSLSTSGGKSVGLLAGTSGTAFIYDSTGTFNITTDTKANIDAGTSSGGTVRFSINSAGAASFAGTLAVTGATTLTGNLTVNGATFSHSVTGTATHNIVGTQYSSVSIGAGAGYSAELAFATGSSRRWLFYKTEAAESGSNAGSNFALYAYTDAGAYLSNPLTINRSTGAVTLASSLTVGSGGSSITGNSTNSGNFTITNTTTTARVSASSGMSTLSIEGPAGQWRELVFKTGTSARWSWDVSTTAESGSNAGSNLALYRYNDAGGSIGTPILVDRATGLTTLSSLTVSGATTLSSFTSSSTATFNGANFNHSVTGSATHNIIGTQYSTTNLTCGSGYTAGVTFNTGAASVGQRWLIFKDESTESGSNAGSNFMIRNYSDAGAYISTPLTITRSTGLTTLTSLTVSGQTTLTGNVISNVSIVKASAAFQMASSSGAATIYFDRPAGNSGQLQFRSGSSAAGLRWALLVNSTAESGSDAGSDFAIQRLTDAGGFIDNALIITRSTGLTTLVGLAVSGTTDSSSSITGAVTTAGGMGIAKKLYVGTDANVAGTIEASDVRAISQVMGAF